MAHRSLLINLILGVTCAASSLGQTSAGSAATAGQEFPVVLLQSVTAGKTRVGSKIQAKLSMSTLVNGTVVPRNATLSGEVVESVSKTKKEPSKIAIRVDSATWKNGSAPVKLYMTPWYYPSVSQAGQDLLQGPAQPPSRTWNGAGAYPDPNSPAYKPFPEGEPDKTQTVPGNPNSVTSNHRVHMKDVEVVRASDGIPVLVSKRSNLKLDRFTTYVLSAEDLLPTK